VELLGYWQRLLHGCKASLPPRSLERNARYGQFERGITVVQNSFELIELHNELHGVPW